jgi:hypothetical protein
VSRNFGYLVFDTPFALDAGCHHLFDCALVAANRLHHVFED